MKRNTESLASHLVIQALITKRGLFLIKTKIDEVPQLVSVIKAKMSLLGLVQKF